MGDTSVSFQVHSVFPTRIYHANLGVLAGVLPRLVEDVLDLVSWDGSSAPCRTREPLENRDGPAWQTYFDVVGTAVDSIAESLHPRPTHRALHSWGLVFRNVDEWPNNFMSIHSHSQATFSTVFYALVPPEFHDTAVGGTLLRNPVSNVAHRYDDADYVRFEATELDLVVFPGYLEHLPERPPDDQAMTLPRVVIATDFCYY